MDNKTIISLSSKDSREDSDSSESLASILTISSEVHRVPVSWDSNKKPHNKPSVILNFGEPPKYLEKVANWMQTCTYEDTDVDFPEIVTESNQSTCIRYDFDKNTPTISAPKSSFTQATSLFSYMKEAKKNVTLKPETQKPNGSHVSKNMKSESPPLSPESQKKELCNYLQLMKPDDLKTSFFVEYRRSGRVKTQNDVKPAKEKLKNKKKAGSESSESEHNGAIGKSEVINPMSVKLKRKRTSSEMSTTLLPLPPKKFYSEVTDFDDCVQDLVNESRIKKEASVNNGCLKRVQKRRRFNFGIKLRQKFKGYFTYKRINLRNKRLRDTSLDELIMRKRESRKKARKKLLQRFKQKKTDEKVKVKKVKKEKREVNAGCEIISVHTNSDDENIDLKNFVDDMLELDKMSEEHRKSVIESRILASSSITNMISKRGSQEADVQRAYKIFSDLSIERKSSEEKENDTMDDKSEDDDEDLEETDQNEIVYSNENNAKKEPDCNICTKKDHSHKNNKNNDISPDSNTSDQSGLVMTLVSEHDYASAECTTNECEDSMCSENEDLPEEEDGESIRESLSPVPIPNLEVLPVKSNIKVKSLHRNLTVNTRKSFLNNYGLHNWSAGANYNKKLNHSITISKKNGPVLCGFYQDYNLILAQQNLISFWTQSALGNVLGAQNMWIPKGEIQRICLNNTYTQKTASDMVLTTETSVAFVELWTKEHKSDVREVPLADVFTTVYFWRVRQTGLDKKALQLEKIQGFADDVQYTVLKWYPKIVVSWHSIQGTEKKTKIRSYHLAADFQTVANISEIQPVQHYVASLHNIEDCDSLVMGCGENKVTLWNVEYGYIVATVEMTTIKSPLSTLWVKCDRGFLFVIQECADQELRLIAINGMNHSWKKLQNYNPPPNFDHLKGVCIENGILVAYYAQGIFCWNAQTGELIVEEAPTECEYIPSGKHVIMIDNENVIVRHSLSHLITDL